MDAIKLIENGTVQVGKIATHILGLDAVCETILKLPEIPGGKKVCYTHKSFPLTAVEDIDGGDELSRGLQAIIAKHGGLWTLEAEKYFLEHGKGI